MLGIDCPIVLDGLGLCTLCTDLGDLVLGGVVDVVDQIVNNIEEDDLKARLVEELGDEATADVATTAVIELASSHVKEAVRGLTSEQRSPCQTCCQVLRILNVEGLCNCGTAVS